MSSASQIPDHIWPLLSQLIDGTLDDAGYADLEAWLIDQPAHQDALLAYCQLHAELGFSQAADDAIEAIRGKAESGERNAEEVLSAEEKDEGGRRKDERRAPDVHSSSFIPHHSLSFFIRNHNFAIAVSVAFVAVAALVGWAAITYLPGVATKDDQDTDTPKPTDFIARLVNENDVEWLHDTKPPVSDPRLWPGRRLAIASGLIEVKYLTGARVVIEGPAEFTVGSTVATAMPPNGSERVKLPFNANGEDHSIDENGGFLRLGKLVARCDTPESKGFTIHTPIGAIEDLGTEFGVYVRDDESAHVTVLDGEVRVTPQAGLGGDAMVLGKGDRAELRSSGGQLVSNRAVAVNFVRRAPVAGDEGVLIAAVDTRIASGAGRPNTMHDDYLSVFAEGNRVQHSLICFDLESVPADRTIEYAELVLTRRTSAPQPQPAWSEENVHRKPMHVFRIVSAWDEAQVTWNRATTNRKWLSSGGDAVGVDGQRFAQPYATSNDNPAPGEKVRWNVTRLVAQWHRGDVPNHGLLLVSPPTNHLHFYSREYHKPGMRPRLVIKLALKQKASTNEEAKSE